MIIDGGLYFAEPNKPATLLTISQGSKIFYNKAGQQEYVINPSEGKASKYVYNSLGQVERVYQSGNVTKEQLSSAISGSSIEFDWRLLSKMTYDGQGRVKEQLTYATKEPAEIIIKPRELSSELTQQQRDILASKKVKLDIRGALIGQVINTYNADGEMQQIQQFGRTEENLFQNATVEFNASHPLDYYLSLDVGEIINVAHLYSNPSDLRYVSQTLYSGLNEGGMATTTKITEFGEKPGDADITRNFTRSYQLRDNWLETKVVGTGGATSGSVSPGSTSSIYDSNGNRKEINEINDNTPDETITRRMLFAADGTLLKKMEGKKGKLTLSDFLTGNGGFTQEAYSYHFTSNGNYLGEVAEGKKSTNSTLQFGKITSTLKNQHFSAPDLTSGTPASNYQVRSGDTLKNIALMFYGNSDYWYLIANTNGLTSDPTAPLVAGMALDIPARATQENTGTSFKPMQLEQIIGDTNPYLPYIPPPPKCNAIAMIVMIAVTVLVSVYLPGAMGMEVGFTSGFVGGFAGSVAGQVTGKALGVVEHFSLKQALVSGVTQGFATGAAETLKASQWAKDAKLVVEAGKHAGELEAAGKMLLAATSVGVNWAANRLVGNNSVSFSWRNVVTSAAAAGAMHGIESIGVGNADNTVGSMLESFSHDNPITGGTVQNIMSAAVSWNVKRGIYGNHFKDEHWNFKEVARDAFGNALGSAIALKLAEPATSDTASSRGNAGASGKGRGKGGSNEQQYKDGDLLFTSEDGLNHYAGVNSYGEVSAIASESFADEQLTETVLYDNPFDRSDLYVPYVMSDKELAGLFATSVYQKFSDNVNRDGHWLGNEAYIALNVDYEKTETFQTGKSVFEFLAYEADQISSGNFDKSFLFGQTAKVADDITSTTPEQVKVKLEKVKKDADNYRENTSKEDMIVDAANMTADLLYGTATGGALTRSTKLSNKLFGYDDKDIDLNGTKSPDLFDLRHSNKGTLDGGILRTVDGDFSIKYGSVIRGQSKIDDARIDEIFRNPITGGYSQNISAKSGSPANYSINSGKPHSGNDASAQVRKSIEANRLAYQHTPKNNGGDAPTPSQRPDAGRGVNASPVVPPSRGSVGGGVDIASRRSYLDAKFGRTGELNVDINSRGKLKTYYPSPSMLNGNEGPKRPGGYQVQDPDAHGNLSPKRNRAKGYYNETADNLIQSHHAIQHQWAKINVQGYKKNEAPGILLPSSSGMSHANISSAQRTRRSTDGFNTNINYEFNTSYREMIEAGVPEEVVKKAMKQSYKYYDNLGAFQ